MIPPDTPPGTMIVAIDDVLPFYGLPGVALGGYYTVERMIESAQHDGQAIERRVSVVLAGHGLGVSYVPAAAVFPGVAKMQAVYWAYPRAAFRLLDLGPLESLLHTKAKS